MTKEEILTFIKNNKNLLKEQFHIETIGLFGSFARDEATDTSDIDLIITTPVKKFSNRYRLKSYLENRLQRPVDIGYLDSLKSYIRKQVEKEVIYV